MLKDIAGIRVCGANFESSSDILFLDPHNGNKIKRSKEVYFMAETVLEKAHWLRL